MDASNVNLNLSENERKEADDYYEQCKLENEENQCQLCDGILSNHDKAELNCNHRVHLECLNDFSLPNRFKN